MRGSESRVTARIRRTEGGQIYHEYVSGDVAYPSLEALQAAEG
jgi:CRISPR/Cas system-associated endonuclease Cas3-HD